jgi:glutamine cyclotransferase
MSRPRIVCVSVCIALVLAACAPELPYRARGRAVQAYPHAREAFTQGLVFDGTTLYESTGLYGNSSLRRVNFETGKVLQVRKLSDQYFAEGCTVWDDQIIQLTWKAGIGFVYDKETFVIEREFEYNGEGWGLTHDGRRLIISDGTSYLRFLDPETLEETDRVQVVDRGSPVVRLNELEWIQGQVWANVWQTPRVARIDAETGNVLGWIDFSELTEDEPRGVLNGIAAKGRKIFVTGKRWEAIYQVEIEPLGPD